MLPSQLSSFLVSFMRVVGSTVVGRNSAVLVGGEGAFGGLSSDTEDVPGERMDDAEAYGTLGLVFRPRPPDTTGDLLAAEAMALRVGGKLTPLAWRDLRLNRKFPAPKPGTISLVGYGGGFLAFDDTADQESLATWYVPYSFSSGVAQKAHVITLDPSGHISIIHGEGLAIVLDKDTGITMRADSTTWLNMKPGEITGVADKIVLQGNVALGAQPAGATPLTAGPVGPTRPSVFLSIA